MAQVQNVRARILPRTPPIDGRAVELRQDAEYIQWRYAAALGVAATEWVDLVALAALVGPEGPAIEMRSDGVSIQYRVVGDVSWIDLVALSTLKGDQGIPGADTGRFFRVNAVDTTGASPSTAYEAGDTVDGVTLTAGMFVLRATSGGNASDGVYVVPASGAASRHQSFAAYNDHPASYFSVIAGTTYATSRWLCVSALGGTLGSTALSLRRDDGGGGPAVVATRTAMKALDPTLKPTALLTENGRKGLFANQLYSSLSVGDQADATADTQEADYAIASPYVWVRMLGVPRSAQRYGMHPDASASDNVTALTAAIAREPYVVIPAEANPYLLNARITSTREGQIIEGEGFNTILKASANYTAGHAMIQCTTARRQRIGDLTIDADSKVAYGVKLDYPKCDLVAAQVKGTNSAGVWMSYFSTFVGDGCNISNNNSLGILVQDGTGQVNDMRIGGGRRSVCESNGYHGIYIGTAGRDGFWVQNWNMENNNTGLTANGSHVTIDAAVSGVHIKDMYHETDLNLASARFYRFASSIHGIGMNNIKMNASSVTTKPAYFITLAYSGGNIGLLSLDNVWAGGFTSALVLNNLDTSAGNDLRFGQVYVQSGSLYSSSTKVRQV